MVFRISLIVTASDLVEIRRPCLGCMLVVLVTGFESSSSPRVSGVSYMLCRVIDHAGTDQNILHYFLSQHFFRCGLFAAANAEPLCDVPWRVLQLLSGDCKRGRDVGRFFEVRTIIIGYQRQFHHRVPKRK